MLVFFRGVPLISGIAQSIYPMHLSIDATYIFSVSHGGEEFYLFYWGGGIVRKLVPFVHKNAQLNVWNFACFLGNSKCFVS